jgi:hypothetical protein
VRRVGGGCWIPRSSSLPSQPPRLSQPRRPLMPAGSGTPTTEGTSTFRATPVARDAANHSLGSPAKPKIGDPAAGPRPRLAQRRKRFPVWGCPMTGQNTEKESCLSITLPPTARSTRPLVTYLKAPRAPTPYTGPTSPTTSTATTAS